MESVCICICLAGTALAAWAVLHPLHPADWQAGGLSSAALARKPSEPWSMPKPKRTELDDVADDARRHLHVLRRSPASFSAPCQSHGRSKWMRKRPQIQFYLELWFLSSVRLYDPIFRV